MDQQQKEKNATVLEWFDALVFSLALVLLVLLFVVRTVNVEGASMVPTLQDGDQLIARSIFYKPRRGDVVVVDGYTAFGQPLVKRVVAVGGDTIDIDFEKGDVYVNDALLDEPYISDKTTRAFDVRFPVTVPPGHVFLLGDNRPYSQDSRHTDIGFIDERDILGKVVFRIMPLNGFGAIQ